MNPFDARPGEAIETGWGAKAAVAALAALIAALLLAPGLRHESASASVDPSEASAQQGRPASASPVAPQLRRLEAREAAAQYLQFEPNRGQAMQSVRYLSRGPQHSVEVFDDGLALSMATTRRGTGAEPASARLHFVGVDAGGGYEAREPAPGRANYLVGADESKWLRDVPRYRQLRRADLYPGIDLVYYSRQGELEFDFVVKPGADPSRIRLHLGGVKAPVIAANGELLLDGKEGALRLHAPVLYQNIDGEKKMLAGAYVLRGGHDVGFRLPEYDHAHPLVIDPTFKLLYSTYLGGVHDDQVGGLVLDAQGDAYVVGNSGSEDWPVSGNAYQARRKAIGSYVRNVVVTKFDASGTLVYSTFIGGSTNDYGNAIAVDAAGRAYVTGYTTSSDFPVTGNALQSTFTGGQNAYLAVLSPDGSALEYSTLYAGGGGSSGSTVRLDASGGVVLAGTAGPGLATTTGAYKTSLATGNAAFVARFNLGASAAGQLVAASYYGTDVPLANFVFTGVGAYAMALDAGGSPWITGQAYTTNLPVTANALMASPTAMTASCSSGNRPLNSFAYVAHLSADLKSLVYASYLTGASGGADTCSEYGHGIAIDPAGNVYIGGSTSSLAYPTTAGAVQASSPANSSAAGYAAFITRIKGDGSALLWSTYFGGDGGATFMNGLGLDSGGALWASVTTSGGTDYPLSTDALQKTHGGGTFDAGFARFDGSSGALLYSSFLGGSGDEGAAGLAIDASGNAYVAGATTSSNFPVSGNAFQPSLTANAFDGSDWFFSILGSGAVSRVLPASSGNGGDVTLSISGAGLQTGATATLVAGATSIAANGGLAASDGSAATFSFSLDGVATGSYDLLVTNPDGSSFTSPAAFHVTAAGAPQLNAQVLGRPKFRTGVTTTFQVVVSNTGTQEALLVPLWISVPASAALAIDNFSVAETTAMLAATDSGTTYVNRLIGKLSPGESTTIDVHLTTSADAANVPIKASLQAPWFRTAAQMNTALSAATYDSDCVADSTNPAYSNCFGPYQNFAAISGRALASGVPLSSRDRAAAADRAHALGDICKAFDHGQEELDKGKADGKEDLGNGKGPGDDGSAFKRDVPNPGKDPIGWINYNAGYINGQFTVITGFVGGGGSSGGSSVLSTSRKKALDGDACPVTPPTPPPTIQPPGSGGGGSGGSLDPNDKTGPGGDGSASHFIRNDASLSYQVEFENQPSATLPAASVVVTDQLDPSKVDLSTFALGPIRFGSTTIAVPAGLSSYQATVALNASLAVRVQGSLDAASGLAKWTFTTLDPATRLPPSDPTLGFLPPDVDGTQGQGAVSFTVRQKAGAANGTIISNQASVVFDSNPAIVTPTWINTVDATAPTSRVESLTGVPGTMNFDVAWSGADSGAGLGTFTVFVSDNGAAYVPWQTSVAATSATYGGVAGHSYAFYVIGTDGAGNVEAAKSTAEASIMVSGAFADPTVGTSSDSGGGGCTIGAAGQRDMSLPLLVIAAAGALLIARRRRAASLRRAAD